MIEFEKIVELFEETGFSEIPIIDQAYEGLKIISQYSDFVIQGADHDIIYSEDVDKLIIGGMTYEEFKKLRNLNWIIRDDEYLAHYV